MDLVILAGGMGSRFGGLKQILPIDKDNNFIIDYSIFDAIRAGFDRVIFIIREENYNDFKSTIGNRLSKVVDVKYVFQRLDDVPKGVIVPKDRVKPWGTAHAMYAIKDIVSDRFAMINADDFYGYESFKIVADFLKSNKEDEFISAGYLVKNTLSNKGAVKRGIFDYDGDIVKGLTESKVEHRENNKIWATPLEEDNWKEISEDTLVSMNMFGFTKKLLDGLNKGYHKFFSQENYEKNEFLIPDVVNSMMKDKEILLKIKSTPAKWYGITYREDLNEFKQAIDNMINEGKYPEHLYK